MLAAPRDQVPPVEPWALRAVDPLHAKEQGCSETATSDGVHNLGIEEPGQLSGTLKATPRSLGATVTSGVES